VNLRRLLLFLLGALIAIAVLYSRHRSSEPGLNVEPHAGEEIEKAKRR